VFGVWSDVLLITSLNRVSHWHSPSMLHSLGLCAGHTPAAVSNCKSGVLLLPAQQLAIRGGACMAAL
jgi:hypothetical protein